MKRSLLVLVAAGLLAGPACSRGGDGDGYRLALDGTAEVDGEALDEGEHTVEVGATLEVLDGDATLALPGDREVLLRAGSTLVVDESPQLLDGDAVVLAAEDTTVDAGDVTLEVDEGAARIQRGVGTTIAMYGGSAAVSSAGRALGGGLRALRQVTVPAEGQLPREPSPLVYDEDDDWDRAYLGDAIALGQDLDGLSRGFTAQLGPGTTVDADLLADVLPIDVDDSLVTADERSPGETLVGAAIVVEADDDDDEDWAEVFGFREDGAEWGLVALDQEVERDPLLGTLDGAFDASPLLFAPDEDGGAGVGATSTTTTTAPAGGGPGTTSPPPTEPPDDDEPDGPGPTVPPITLPPLTPPDEEDPEEPPPDDPVETVVDLVGDLLDGEPRTDAPEADPEPLVDELLG